jgi:hypothetical protein
MRGMPNATQVAEIVWAECGGIRASATQVTSAATYAHRLAIALCVVNRGRQGLPWGDGVQTCAPRGGPSAADRSQPAVQAAWTETQRAAGAAMQTVSQPLNSEATLRGAQLYCHTWTAPITGIRLEGVYVASYAAWDPRSTIRVRIHGTTVEYPGPRTVWLSVHVIERARDRAIARERGGTPTSPAPQPVVRHVPFGPQE